MLGGGEHPPRALKLVDPAQPLHPGRVDEILFCRTAGHTARSALGDAKVSVDWIAGQIHARVLGACLIHEPIIAMSSLLAEGVDLFNAGRYWEAHEAWEREWTPDRKGSDSGFYKGLIQVAAGCLHYSRHNRRGAINKWRSGADYLRPYLPAHRGLRLVPLVGTVDGFLTAMNGRDWPLLQMPTIAQE
ncbi:MAG: DUF309 domain-containing protein [Chloroflexi bacterium]|nr:MAG: DUF309 domain-containing protein [Chloroflexota bacterium]TMG59824.1 MAG: DUF309 domain-containing protein [Chloroflexota bacterium]